MSFQNAGTTCASRCRVIGGGVGLVGMLLLWTGPASFLGALFWGVVLAVGTGLVLTYLLCGEDARAEAAAEAPIPDTVTVGGVQRPVSEVLAAAGRGDGTVESADAGAVQEHEPDRGADGADTTPPEESLPDPRDASGDVAALTGGTRPLALTAARESRADDLTRIKGVGPKLEALLHDLGIYHFDQIAAWSADEIAWVDANLKGFRGRVSRDSWVDQARLLASDGETALARRLNKRGEG